MGVEFKGSLHDLYKTNLWLRTASRLLVRLGCFHATAFPELRRKATGLAWEEYLAPEKSIAMRVACQRSRLYHETAVAERIAGAIAERVGKPPSVRRYSEDPESDPPQLILVRFVDNLCTVSIDSSGALLHRRGYRLATAKAPLRETFASAMLLASEWDLRTPLLDPFCGSGTIPIEAALMAANIPPGLSRRFAFMDWPHFESKLWNQLISDAKKKIIPQLPAIMASDRDEGAIRAAKANAERAGVANFIEFSCKAISSISPPPGPGWVVTNPPYGVRLGRTPDLRNLYAQMGKIFRAKCPIWRVVLLCGNRPLIQRTGLKIDQEYSLVNSGLRVALVKARIP